jgi:hypothetical protein
MISPDMKEYLYRLTSNKYHVNFSQRIGGGMGYDGPPILFTDSVPVNISGIPSSDSRIHTKNFTDNFISISVRYPGKYFNQYTYSISFTTYPVGSEDLVKENKTQDNVTKSIILFKPDFSMTLVPIIFRTDYIGRYNIGINPEYLEQIGVLRFKSPAMHH